jgi:RNA polymerase sigma-70 factor (ECF subfamily)
VSLTGPPERTLNIPFLWAKEKAASDSSVSLGERMSTSSDAVLMEALKERDHRALAELFRCYSRLVFSIGFRVLQDAGEAEEIVQDVFLYVYERAGQFDPVKGAAKSWIVQIAHSRSLDRRSFLQRRQFYGGTDIADFADTLAGAYDVERQVMSKWNLSQLQVALRELPEKQRRTLKLFFFEGVELKEIAQHIGETPENARHYYYRGLQKLRKNGLVRTLKGKETE